MNRRTTHAKAEVPSQAAPRCGGVHSCWLGACELLR